MVSKKKAPRRAPAKDVLDEGLIKYTEMLVKAALSEDIGPGDVTTLLTVPLRKRGSAKIIARERLVVSGQFVAKASAFRQLNSKIVYKELIPDGSVAKKGEVVATISGNLRSILTAERVALELSSEVKRHSYTYQSFCKEGREGYRASRHPEDYAMHEAP